VRCVVVVALSASEERSSSKRTREARTVTDLRS